jgi:hypothetical protein
MNPEMFAAWYRALLQRQSIRQAADELAVRDELTFDDFEEEA